jgi:hypothetical protein
MAQGIGKMCQFASPPAQNLTALLRSDFNTGHAGDAGRAFDVANRVSNRPPH